MRGPTVVWNVTKGGELLSGEPTEMITVPAVEGRLLRFQGDALHAVPRPADVYWTHVDGLPDRPETQRSVLLFNLWPTDYLLKDVEILPSTPNHQDENKEENLMAKTEKGDHHSCNPKSEWKPVEVVDFVPPVPTWWELATTTVYEEFWIPLMGSSRRRGTDRYFVPLEGTTEVRGFFSEENKVVRTRVSRAKERFLGWEL